MVGPPLPCFLPPLWLWLWDCRKKIGAGGQGAGGAFFGGAEVWNMGVYPSFVLNNLFYNNPSFVVNNPYFVLNPLFHSHSLFFT